MKVEKNLKMKTSSVINYVPSSIKSLSLIYFFCIAIIRPEVYCKKILNTKLLVKIKEKETFRK